MPAMPTVPVVPTVYGVAVFVLLLGLLVQKEILRALGRTSPQGWRLISNLLIGMLLVVYGLILLSRLINIVQ